MLRRALDHGRRSNGGQIQIDARRHIRSLRSLLESDKSHLVRGRNWNFVTCNSDTSCGSSHSASSMSTSSSSTRQHCAHDAPRRSYCSSLSIPALSCIAATSTTSRELPPDAASIHLPPPRLVSQRTHKKPGRPHSRLFSAASEGGKQQNQEDAASSARTDHASGSTSQGNNPNANNYQQQPPEEPKQEPPPTEEEEAERRRAFEEELQNLSNQILLVLGSLSLGFMTLRFFVPRFGIGALFAAATFVGCVASVLQGTVLWPVYIAPAAFVAHQGFLYVEALRVQTLMAEMYAELESRGVERRPEDVFHGENYETNKYKLTLRQQSAPHKTYVIRVSRPSKFHTWRMDTIDEMVTSTRTVEIFRGR
ncbi:unnamed protein product [Amoebophrya sp. A120]|nr:unnamed protein product [Amoebophrya sp. A120]|eukprot:GSA120T00003757001.1